MDSRVTLFRVSTCISIIGVSLLCFVTASLIKEQSARSFSFFHSFCTGIVLGTGFVTYLWNSMSGDLLNINTALILSSSSFMLVMWLEYYNSSLSNEYTVLSTSGDENDPIDEDDDIELPTYSNELGADIDEPSGMPRMEELDIYPIPSSDGEGAQTSFVKVYPSILLCFASTTSFLDGFTIATQLHRNIFSFAWLLYDQALMAFTLGAILVGYVVPQGYFLLFMLCFSLSASIGILSGSGVHLGEESVQNLRLVMDVVDAVSAGVFLNIAVMHILPTEVYSTNQSSNQQTDKCCKYLLMVLGYLVCVLPYLLRDNT